MPTSLDHGLLDSVKPCSSQCEARTVCRAPVVPGLTCYFFKGIDPAVAILICPNDMDLHSERLTQDAAE